MQVLVMRVAAGLSPADSQAWEEIQKIKPGDEVLCEVKRARNPKQHRLFWGLVGYVHEHQTTRTKVQIANLLKCAVGWCDEFTDKAGNVIRIPKSIAEANMGPADFEDFLTRVLDFVAAELIPNVTASVVRAELERIVFGTQAPSHIPLKGEREYQAG